MAMKRILTTSQREQLLSVDHLSEEDFKAYFSFSDYDLEVINQHRGKVNKLGFAIQLCLARYPGCSLSNWPIKSTRLTSYVSRQLHLDAIDLNSYDHRNTRANHFNEILEVFNYHRFGSANTQKQLIEYLIELALENDDSIYLMKKTIDFLTRKRIIFPSIATLEDIISRCRDKAENNLFSILLCSLTDIQIEKLESLFQIYEETKITKLAWLKDIPGKANPESFMSICKKVASDYNGMMKGLVKKYNKYNEDKLPHITPHSLRHTFCTNYANAGMNPKALQYIMGHANIAMTLNYYAHATFDSAMAEMKRLNKEKQQERLVA